MLIIERNITANGIPVAHHMIQRAELSPDGDAITLHMASWHSAEARLSGMDPLARAAPRFMLAHLPTASGILADLGALLTAEGPLAGGVVAHAGPQTVEDARRRKWALLKLERDEKEFSGFVWDGANLDSDAMSQSRIQGAVILAMQAAAAGQQFSVTWTLANNTTRTFSGTQMLAIGSALAQHVITVHQVAQWLRSQLDAADTIEAVQAIEWPANNQIPVTNPAPLPPAPPSS